ncbi:aryl-alcohol dehydrogenase-like predicted oxidoreductase [Planifilum fimeticola]|uniref:Aryl-alcohol dehydrogenase-like predicted oxidoreductase n=1 Tax=Planifilum fimeticola TaxID=201975 RepID=A0A2T0LAF4_9BACL|nr:aldo/keto reductase [Planifilum fimeticola]PRX38780.1 aryl-alcohol dehydrogenase-like predicted oxidoreductase [Planifilum fimeticola]
MQYARLGTSELEVSRIGMGTGGWMWDRMDESEAAYALHRAIDLGINLIDTAPLYGFGRAEEIIGKALVESRNRNRVVIATKAGLEWDARRRIWWCNASRERILEEIGQSLRRLRTDWIDLYQIHWPDPETPIEETAETLLSLYEKGVIRAVGVSNFRPEQMEAWRKVAPLHANQLQLNLFRQHFLETAFRHCRRHDIGTLAWGTLASGLLTGKFSADTSFPENDARRYDPMFQGERFRQYLAATEELKKAAAERGRTVTQLAVRWTLQQPGVTVALWGARRPDHLDEVPGVFGWSLSHQDFARIDDILRKTVTKPLPPPPADFRPPLPFGAGEIEKVISRK